MMSMISLQREMTPPLCSLPLNDGSFDSPRIARKWFPRHLQRNGGTWCVESTFLLHIKSWLLWCLSIYEYVAIFGNVRKHLRSSRFRFDIAEHESFFSFQTSHVEISIWGNRWKSDYSLVLEFINCCLLNPCQDWHWCERFLALR